MRSKEQLGLVIGPALFVIFGLLVRPADMSVSAAHALGAILWIAVWWVTEAVPIPITSLLPLVLFPLLGLVTIEQMGEAYADELIFLFMGGFMLALALEKWNLHRRIALSIILAVGTNTRLIVLGFMLATAFLSMWISNTATTLMMIPIGLALYAQVGGETTGPVGERFGKALLMGIAYAASIGGMATIVGTPTNAIFVKAVEDNYGQSIAFDQWFLFGLPISIVLLVASWWYLVRVAQPLPAKPLPGSRDDLAHQLAALGPLSWEERWVLGTFATVAIAWISRSYVLKPLVPEINDTIIVLAGIVPLFFIPARARPGKLMDWETANRLPWGILLLFGGAFALALAFDQSGLGNWLAGRFAAFGNMPFWLILLALVAFTNFITEITQNIATCTLIMPVIVTLAPEIGVHPLGLMAGTAVAASCAFMLPFATAPNAIVFGTGHLRMTDMMRAGFALNIISILLTSALAYWLLPVAWGYDATVFPVAWLPSAAG
jgi:solute carrier family 13 (sodium-dependent dicarboxylate transporter), member 2/3/5